MTNPREEVEEYEEFEESKASLKPTILVLVLFGVFLVVQHFFHWPFKPSNPPSLGTYTMEVMGQTGPNTYTIELHRPR